MSRPESRRLGPPPGTGIGPYKDELDTEERKPLEARDDAAADPGVGSAPKLGVVGGAGGRKGTEDARFMALAAALEALEAVGREAAAMGLVPPGADLDPSMFFLSLAEGWNPRRVSLGVLRWRQ